MAETQLNLYRLNEEMTLMHMEVSLITATILYIILLYILFTIWTESGIFRTANSPTIQKLGCAMSNDRQLCLVQKIQMGFATVLNYL